MKRDRRAVTLTVFLLCMSAVVVPFFPTVEAVLNTIALWVGGVVVVIMVGLVVKDTWL